MMQKKNLLADCFYYFKAFLIGLGICLVFWVLESYLQGYYFKSGPFHLWPHDSDELWDRLFIIGLLMTISFIVAYFFRVKLLLVAQLHTAQLALNQMRHGILITDKSNKIIYTNPRYTDLTGFSLDEVIGKNPSLSNSHKHDKNFYQQLWKTLYDKGFWEGEIWNRRKSGELYPEWLSISLIKDSKGQPLYHVGIMSDISDQKEAEEKIKYYAYYDPLTNLPNRRFFLENLQQAIKAAKREKQKLAVLFIDVDDFKPINDNYSHRIGDLYLCELAAMIKCHLREADILARLGGDEFVLLLANISFTVDVKHFVNKLLNELFITNVQIEGHRFKLKVSIGYAIYPEDSLIATKLIHIADKKMYQMKEVHKRASGYNRQE